MSNTSYDAKDMVRSMDSLVSLPGIYFEVKKLMDDPYSTTAQLGDVICNDPALTARLLRVANSAYFGCPAHFDTVSHAANYLGFQHIHDLVLSTAIANTFSHISQDVMDMNTFWSGSVYAAVAARSIAAHCNLANLERLFVQGLLHDIGHLIMYSVIPELSQQAMITARSQSKPLQAVEKNIIGCDYAEVGSALLEFWRLPVELQEVVRFHTHPERAQAASREAAIVHVAATLAHAVVSDQKEEEWQLSLNEFAMGQVDMALDDLYTVKVESDEKIKEVLDLFAPGTRLPTRRKPWAVPA